MVELIIKPADVNAHFPNIVTDLLYSFQAFYSAYLLVEGVAVKIIIDILTICHITERKNVSIINERHTDGQKQKQRVPLQWYKNNNLQTE